MIDNICVVIPAYNPEKKVFLDFLKKLCKEFSKIVVVNDGSNSKYDEVFNKIQNENIIVLKHNVNLGKGRASKTAFNYVLNEYPDCKGIVEADCDGQHSVKDIIKCSNALLKNESSLVLGVRDFSQKDVPPKSKFGNKLTRNIFKIFIGLNIQDTQTGLRAIGVKFMKHLMNTKGERYEFETNMLIECKLNNINIIQVPISTIYIDKNKNSKFNPIKDSLSIYKLFAKYILSSISSFIIDIVLFNLLFLLLNNFKINNNIVIATVIARIFSSLYNFAVNAKMVFRNNFNKKSLLKYIILVIVQMFISAFSVDYLSKIIQINVVWVKIIVDMLIFVANFIIQRECVFKY